MISSKELEPSYVASLLGVLLSEKFIPKFARNTAYFLSTCMGKIIRCHSDIIGFIISKRAHRVQDFGLKSKNGKFKDDYPKCRDRMDRRKRVVSADFLASLAYNHRECKRKGHNEADYDDNYSSATICKKSGSNTNDVRINKNVGQAWWASMLERGEHNACDFQNSVSKSAAQSRCSKKISEILTIKPSLEKSMGGVTPILNDSSPATNLCHSLFRNGSKSEPRNLPCRLNRRKTGGSTANVTSKKSQRYPKNGKRRRREKTRSSNPGLTECTSIRVNSPVLVPSCKSF